MEQKKELNTVTNARGKRKKIFVGGSSTKLETATREGRTVGGREGKGVEGGLILCGENRSEIPLPPVLRQHDARQKNQRGEEKTRGEKKPCHESSRVKKIG